MNALVWQSEPCAECGAKPVTYLEAGPDGFLTDESRPLCRGCTPDEDDDA